MFQTAPADVSAVVRRNNIKLAGRSDGPAIVFAHGLGCDQDMWQRLIPYFIEDYRLVLFDHVGAGNSDLEAYNREKYSSLEGYAEDLLEICDVLDLKNVVLVAHSVSAMVAILAAARNPAPFADLILVAPSPRYTNDPNDGYVGGFSEEDIDGLLESLDSNHFAWAANLAPMVMGNPKEPELAQNLRDSFCRTNPSIFRHFARVTFLSDTRRNLADVSTRSLVLQCSDDLLAPPEVGSYLHQNLPGSVLVHLEATGHCPHVSSPRATAAAIRHYLDQSP